MTISKDMRWRCIVLYYVYSQSSSIISRVLGVSKSSVLAIKKLFDDNGVVMPDQRKKTNVKWANDVVDFVKKYVNDYPQFYLEELQEALIDKFKSKYPELPVSIPTLCRALKHVLKLTRKVLEKRAREATAKARTEYIYNLSNWYMYPQQLVFVDETSKDGRDGQRRYARSAVNTKAIVKVKFGRGLRISAIAACSLKDSLAAVLRMVHSLEVLSMKTSFHIFFPLFVLGQCRILL